MRQVLVYRLWTAVRNPPIAYENLPGGLAKTQAAAIFPLTGSSVRPWALRFLVGPAERLDGREQVAGIEDAGPEGRNAWS